jgi:hypothetical protein
MKKIYSFIASVCLLPMLTFGQITIVSTDMAQAGDAVTRDSDTLATVTEGSAGANQTWIMTNVTPRVTETTQVKLASATPYASSFTSSNLAMTNDNASYVYFNQSTNSLISTGLAGDLLGNGSIITAPLNPTLLIHNFPRTYGDNFSDTYGLDVTTSGVSFGVYQVRFKRTATALDSTDGWGKITTPTGTYNSLRTKHVEYVKDTTWIKILPISPWSMVSATADTTKSFNWLAKETKLAVAELTFDTLGNPKKFVWSKIAPTSGASIDNQLSKAIQLEVYPNPAKETLWLKVGENVKNEDYVFEIYNVQGQLVKSEKVALQANKSEAIDLSELHAGIYSWKMSNITDNQSSAGRFSILK